MDESIKDQVFSEVETAVERKVNEVIDPQDKSEHQVGELNFLRKAQVSNVVEERTLLASYGEIQFDCNCTTSTRIDFQECVPIEDRDVSFIFEVLFCIIFDSDSI